MPTKESFTKILYYFVHHSQLNVANRNWRGWCSWPEEQNLGQTLELPEPSSIITILCLDWYNDVSGSHVLHQFFVNHCCFMAIRRLHLYGIQNLSTERFIKSPSHYSSPIPQSFSSRKRAQVMFATSYVLHIKQSFI